MSVTEITAEPLSRCGTCGQTDDEPKHMILVGFNNESTEGQMFHEHDHDRDGVIHYHFHCATPWHDLHARLATSAFDSPNPDEPWRAWEESSAAEHRKVADEHAAICAKAREGLRGDELRQFIANLHVRGGAGGIDQTRATEILAAYGINSSTSTVGSKTITGPIHMRLFTTNGSDASTGTELTTSGGYTAGGSALSFATASAGSIATNAAVSWTSMPSTTLTGMEEWDTSATPLRLFWAPWTVGSIVVASGNTFTVASGSLTNSLA
jgi:hypothetical protein